MITVLSEGPVRPLYARVSGAEEDEARKLLAGKQVKLFPTASDAVEAVVKGA